ncbi:hypothetical protein LCGC14_1515400, partial [marine sediment metagenome]
QEQQLPPGVQVKSVYSTKKLSITDPRQEEWDLETWEENIPERFDSLTTISSDGTTLTQNRYEETIIIELPSRFSLYNDLYSNDPGNIAGSTQFTITGMLITPSDGMVYDTSNKELFKAGAAKSPGKYFYYDSDNDGFYETVYILENPKRYVFTGSRALDKVVYTVKSIGYNYDGEHSFSPYRKVNRRIKSKTDFDQLEAEGTQRFASSFWAYNFKGLKSIDLLFPDDPFDGYEIQDHIFEISKLVRPSEFNSKFPELFYEVRHRAYFDAWEIYKKQLAQDVIEQVFMTVTASIVSSVVRAFFIWIPFVGTGLAALFGTLAYIGVYTILTKFNMDMKAHKAQAIERANTYIPISMDEYKPKSLNERSLATHGYWDESTVAAMMGHPGAYYTEIQGESNNQLYTAYAIASPANILRDNAGKNWGGFMDFIWDNMWKAASSNPDLMIGLDFDTQALDYFLLTSELPSLNDNPDYTFEASSNNGLYNQYRHNTIGYLQQKIAEETDADLSLIKPMVIGGIPQYVFVDGTDSFNQITMPASHLYQPVIVSSAQNVRNEGIITVNIQTVYTSNTKGISHDTIFPESELYPSKVSLSSHGFEYPIKFIKLELIEDTPTGTISIKDITLTPRSPDFRDFFYVELGNIYFRDNIDSILISDQPEFDSLISGSSTKKYYRLTIKFDMVIQDSGSEDHKRMALSQATAYGVMDYMNQYTYAKQTADMIGDIAYTETMTLISTAISAAALLLGEWAVSGIKELFKQASKEVTKKVVEEASKSILKQFGMAFTKFVFAVGVGSIKEMFEEIIVDGILETWGEKFIAGMGGSEDQAFWFTSLLTSGREGLSGIRSTVMKAVNMKFGKTKIAGAFRDMRGWFATKFATDTNKEIIKRNEASEKVNAEFKDGKNEQDLRLKEDKVNSWTKMIGSGLFRILRTVIPAFFMGGLLFTNTFATLGMVKQIKGFGGDIIGRYQTLKVNMKKRGRNDKIAELNDHMKTFKESWTLSRGKDGASSLNQAYLEENGENLPEVADFPENNNPMNQESLLRKSLRNNMKFGIGLALSPSGMSNIFYGPDGGDGGGQRKMDQFLGREEQTAKAQGMIEKDRMLKEIKNNKPLDTISGGSRVVKINLDDLSTEDRAIFNQLAGAIDNEKINGFSIWDGISNTFTIPSDPSLTVADALNFIKKKLGINPEVTMFFSSETYGTLDYIRHRDKKTFSERTIELNNQKITINSDTKFSVIE